MSVFCCKKIDTTACLGELLKKTREEKQYDLEQMSKSTHIPKKYLLAMEENNFNELPLAQGYRFAYVRQYAKILGLSANNVLYQFRQENKEEIDNTEQKLEVKMIKGRSLSMVVKNLLVAAVILIFIGYLFWQVQGILVPPKLIVSSPVEGYVTNNPSVLVQGETDRETHLTINGKDIMINDKGQFESQLDLSNGVNTIIISTTKKHGKTTVITRHVVVNKISN